MVPVCIALFLLGVATAVPNTAGDIASPEGRQFPVQGTYCPALRGVYFSAAGVRDKKPLSGVPNKYVTIPFRRLAVNFGNAFDLSTNEFTAPVSGVYRFDLVAFKSAGSSSSTNNAYLGITSVNHPEDDVLTYGANGDSVSLSVHGVMNLKAGDKVRAHYKGRLHYNRQLVDEIAYPDDSFIRFSGELLAACG